MALLVDGRSLQTPSQLRGIGRYTLALLRCLKGRSRCRFLFFDPPPEEFSSQALLYPGPRRMISWLDNLFLPPLFRRFGITLYHSPAYALPGRIRGCRSLLTLHDLTPLHFAEDFSWRNRRVISRLVGSIADADLLLTDSEATWEDLVSRGLDRGVPHRVVYPPLTAFSDLEPPQMELPQEYLLFCGGPDRVKNLETAIAGAGLAGIPLVVAGPGRGGGEGPRRSSLRRSPLGSLFGMALRPRFGSSASLFERRVRLSPSGGSLLRNRSDSLRSSRFQRGFGAGGDLRPQPQKRRGDGRSDQEPSLGPDASAAGLGGREEASFPLLRRTFRRDYGRGLRLLGVREQPQGVGEAPGGFREWRLLRGS